MRDAFFIQTGIGPDVSGLRRLCIRLSLYMKTGYDYFVNLQISELMAIVEEVNKIAR